MQEQIVATAIADDANAHALSVLSGPHMTLFDQSQLVEIQRLTVHWRLFAPQAVTVSGGSDAECP
jgi:hypothetical protein